MDFKTIERVPILSTGTYKLGSGETTFTADDLKAAVLAAGDPTVSLPRIKIGHHDERFESDPALDGEPAMGTVRNMALSEDGQTIVADLADVPAWLADSMASAYPGRSVEGGFGYQAPSGHRYDFVISDLALLGTTWPGVGSLDDLRDVLEKNGTVSAAVEKFSDRFVSVRAAASKISEMDEEDQAEARKLVAEGKTEAQAIAIVERSSDERNEERDAERKAPKVAAAGPGNRSAEERRTMAAKGEAMSDGTFPIGTRSEAEAAARLARTPAQRAFVEKRCRALDCADVIPESWKGGTEAALDVGAIPRTFAADLRAGRITGLDEKAWPRSVEAADDGALSILVDAAGKLLRLPITVADKALSYGEPRPVEAAHGPLDNLQGPRVLASWPSNSAVEPERKVMKLDVDQTKLAAALGLAEDADEAAIQAKLGIEPGTTDETVTTPAPVAASSAPLPEGVVAIDAAKLADLEVKASAGASVKVERDSERDEADIASAIEGGRIVASSAADWRERFKVDREGTHKLLTASREEGGLAAVIPVGDRETGRSGGTEQSVTASLPRLFPELRETEVAA